MVSLRALHEQEEAARRKQRIAESRRVSSLLGVERARDYEQQRRAQDAVVKHHLQQRWEGEQGEQRLLLQCIAAEGTIRQGEGMRNAAIHMDRMHRRSHVEADAWAAEHVLEQERYALALERAKLEQQSRVTKAAEAANRRHAAKVMEQERSRLTIERSLQQSRASNDVSRATALSERQRSNGTASVSVNISESRIRGVCGGDGAKRHTAARDIAVEEQQAKAALEQRKAALRAQQVVKEMKLQEEQRRIEEEQEVMLKESMVANAMRSALRPISATDFQEQEARKAQSMQRDTEKEFERTFLQGPWSMDSIERYHEAPTYPFLGVDATEASEEERSCLMHAAIRLAVFPFVATVLSTAPLDVSVDEDPDPLSAEQLPEPTPRPSPSPPQPEEMQPTHYAEAHDAIAFQAAVPIDTDTTHVNVAPTDASTFTPLRERQEKFLKDLEALQNRLASATTSRPQHKDVNSSGSTHMTAEGDMSISSMSSQEASIRATCTSEDASTTNDSREVRKSSFGMSAHQLRASIKKMQHRVPHKTVR